MVENGTERNLKIHVWNSYKEYEIGIYFATILHHILMQSSNITSIEHFKIKQRKDRTNHTLHQFLYDVIDYIKSVHNEVQK